MTDRAPLVFLLVCLGSCTGQIEPAFEPSDDRAASSPGGGDPAAPSDPQLPVGSAFAPGPGGLRRLTGAQFQASIHDLLGVTPSAKIEADTYTAGLAQVGASFNRLSARGVESLESLARESLQKVFADARQRDALVGCTPAGSRDDGCARAFLARFGRRAWRGSVPASDVDRYVTVAGQVSADQNDFFAGLLTATSAMLQSPRFLYRVELGEALPGRPGWLRYTSLEMATRLSYLLWNTTPDPALLDVAEGKGLLDLGQLRAEAGRLLDSPRAREGLASVVDEVFGLGALETMPKDVQMYSLLTPTLRQAMRTEVQMMYADLIFGRRGDFQEIFDGTKTFANQELARLYGLKVAGDAFAPVVHNTSTGRAGIMGTAALLSLLSKPAGTSPTARGKFIREVLMCQTIPAPPKNVNTMIPEPPTGVSRRKQLDQHRKDPACAGCHGLMDPLGYALETFDALGIYRKTDRGVAIDGSGTLDGATFANARELGQRLHENPATGPCLVRTLFRYATGRSDATTEQGLLDDLDGRFKAGGNKVRELLLDIVLSDGFRFAQGEKRGG